jgi:hypothetical protein
MEGNASIAPVGLEASYPLNRCAGDTSQVVKRWSLIDRTVDEATIGFDGNAYTSSTCPSLLVDY